MKKKPLLYLAAFIISTQNCLAGNIQFNEIHPNPAGRDNGKEWIELYNSGNSSINLKNWQTIQLKTKKKIKTDTIIPPKSYHLIYLPLRNKENTLAIINESGIEQDKIQYKETRENLSFSKIADKWHWVIPTKNQKNPVFQEISGKTIFEPPDNLIINNQKFPLGKNNPLLLEAIFKNERYATISMINTGNSTEIGNISIKNLQPQKKQKPPVTLVVSIIITVFLLILTCFMEPMKKS